MHKFLDGIEILIILWNIKNQRVESTIEITFDNDFFSIMIISIFIDMQMHIFIMTGIKLLLSSYINRESKIGRVNERRRGIKRDKERKIDI